MEEITVILISLKIASIASLFSLPFGIAVGYVLARKSFFPLKKFLVNLVNLPLILPPVVTGYLLLIFLEKMDMRKSFY